jgi:hypothetical protein
MLRTRLTLQPGRPGTKRLLKEYGQRLVCVRYRYDDVRHRRLKTVELVVEDVPWIPREAPEGTVDIDIGHFDEVLRAEVRRKGGCWEPATCTWRVSYETVRALGLQARIVLPMTADARASP